MSSRLEMVSLQLHDLTFFIDRCLGTEKVATVLRENGVVAELHDDHFSQGAQDEA